MGNRHYNYKHSESKDGEYSARLNAENTALLKYYCKITNTSKKDVVNMLVKEGLPKLMEEQIVSVSLMDLFNKTRAQEE